MWIVGTSVADNCLYSTIQQCYTQRARNQVCCPRVGNPTNLQVRWYAESRKANMPNRYRLLTPHMRKAFLWGLLRYQAKREAFHAMKPLKILRNYFQINDIDTFDQNSCQYERFCCRVLVFRSWFYRPNNRRDINSRGKTTLTHTIQKHFGRV